MATIVDGKKRIPFMRGMLVHYLIEHDFDHEDAREVANLVRDGLGKADDVQKKDMVKLVEKAIRKKRGETGVLDAFPHPGVAEGVAGMKFVRAAVTSSKKKGAWTRV